VEFSRPTSSFGYYRGAPLAGGSGSGMGQPVSGANVFTQGQGSAVTGGASGWTPTILYLFVLILIEMFVFAFISRKV
jgi:hypothetical protein